MAVVTATHRRASRAAFAQRACIPDKALVAPIVDRLVEKDMNHLVRARWVVTLRVLSKQRALFWELRVRWPRWWRGWHWRVLQTQCMLHAHAHVPRYMYTWTPWCSRTRAGAVLLRARGSSWQAGSIRVRVDRHLKDPKFKRWIGVPPVMLVWLHCPRAVKVLEVLV